jgi:hypothetical protein
MKSSLDKIFYKIMYHHIICMCDFLLNLDNFLSWFAWIITKIMVSTIFSPSFSLHFVIFSLCSELKTLEKVHPSDTFTLMQTHKIFRKAIIKCTHPIFSYAPY